MTQSNKSAFRRGFCAGFSSPYQLVYGSKRHYEVAPSDLLSASWHQVGKSLKVAIESERPKNGEVTRTKAHTG